MILPIPTRPRVRCRRNGTTRVRGSYVVLWRLRALKRVTKFTLATSWLVLWAVAFHPFLVGILGRDAPTWYLNGLARLHRGRNVVENAIVEHAPKLAELVYIDTEALYCWPAAVLGFIAWLLAARGSSFVAWTIACVLPVLVSARFRVEVRGNRIKIRRRMLNRSFKRERNKPIDFSVSQISYERLDNKQWSHIEPRTKIVMGYGFREITVASGLRRREAALIASSLNEALHVADAAINAVSRPVQDSWSK